MANDKSQQFVDALDAFPQTLTLDPPSPQTTGLRRRRSKLTRPSKPLADESSAVTNSDPGPSFSVDSRPRSSCLEFAVALVIKSLLFQVNLLISCVAFPFWLLHCGFKTIVDPLGTVKRAVNGVRTRFVRVSSGLFGRICLPLFAMLGSQQDKGKLVTGVVLGCLWSFYVCVVLSGLLAIAFLAGSVFLGQVVEEPVRIVKELSFDYTKVKPDAFVPIGSCSGVSWSGEKVQVGNYEGGRVVPANHKLGVTVSLVMPESDYNKRLGMFQVRVELLSADCWVLSTSSQPCMLRFKSTHMYLIETFLRSVTLLSGFSTEAQVIKVKMAGFNEGTEPTACLRVILEQRAEFRHGAGIPEIYSASVKLESQLPLFKQIIWNWRRTLLVWTTMVLFISQLFFLLLCCRPIIIPTPRPSGGPTRSL